MWSSEWDRFRCTLFRVLLSRSSSLLDGLKNERALQIWRGEIPIRKTLNVLAHRARRRSTAAAKRSYFMSFNLQSLHYQAASFKVFRRRPCVQCTCLSRFRRNSDCISFFTMHTVRRCSHFVGGKCASNIIANKITVSAKITRFCILPFSSKL